jgi:hypothetical protein
MGGIPTNMFKHLKKECSNINEEFHDSLHDLINTNNTSNKNRSTSNKHLCTETVELSDGNK